MIDVLIAFLLGLFIGGLGGVTALAALYAMNRGEDE